MSKHGVNRFPTLKTVTHSFWINSRFLSPRSISRINYRFLLCHRSYISSGKRKASEHDIRSLLQCKECSWKENGMWGLPLTCTFLIMLETYITLYLNKSRSIGSPGLHPLAVTSALPQQAMGPSCKADLRTDEHSRMNLSPFCWVISQINRFLGPQPFPIFPFLSLLFMHFTE